jgi:hypothetical protein
MSSPHSILATFSTGMLWGIIIGCAALAALLGAGYILIN